MTGRLSEERLDASVRRILTLKAAYGLFDLQTEARSQETLNGVQVADEIGRLSITLARDSAGLLPLAAGARLLVIAPDDGLRVYYQAALERTPLGLALGAAGFQVRELTYRARSDDAQAEVYWQALSLAAQYDAVLMGTWDAAIPTMGSSAWQQRLVPELLLRNPRLIGIALRTPYDVELFPTVSTFLATYGGVPAQMQALAAVLRGDEAPMGVFPVAVALEATPEPSP